MSLAEGTARVPPPAPDDAPVADGPRRYEEQRSLGIAALQEGRLAEAAARLQLAAGVAREIGDPELVDRAACNLAAVDIARGELAAPLPELRRILMLNRSPENCFLAAYNMARAYELSKDVKKGLFYARIARDRAAHLGRAEWSYGAGNQLANLLTADSHFEQAAREYRVALRLVPRGQRHRQLEGFVNLGYCELMLGRLRRALAILYRSVRVARRHGLARLETIARLDLGYALLEAGRSAAARRHVERGLAMAEASGEVDVVKNALFLAGEARRACGDEAGARATHRELQRRFYPDQPMVAELLGAVDVRPLINLRA